MQSTAERLTWMIRGYGVSQAIYVATKFGIPDLIDQGKRSAEEIAAHLKMPEDRIYRLLRFLASVEIFEEEADRSFRLTHLSKLLCKDAEDSLYGIATYYGRPTNYLTWSHLEEGIASDACPFEKQFGMPFFEYHEQDLEAGAYFNAAMVNLTQKMASLALKKYGFPKQGTYIDIAGGYGQLIRHILDQNPKLNGIVMDRAEVISAAKKNNEMQEYGDRFKFVEGDFFKSIPEDGDVYSLKHIIHDWDDEDAIKILLTTYHAMPAKSKLLIFEYVIDDNPEEKQAMAKWYDLHMLALLKARERTLSQYQTLLEKSNFKFNQLIPLHDGFSIIECEPIK